MNSTPPARSQTTHPPTLKRSSQRRDSALGPQVNIYRSPHWTPRQRLARIGAGALGVLAPLGYGAWRADYAAAQFGPKAAEAWSRPWYGLATLGLVVFSILVFYHVLQSLRYVAVHKNGLRIRLSPLRRRALRYSDISGISTCLTQVSLFHLLLPAHLTARLYPTLGPMIDLPGDLENLPELVTYLKNRLYPRLLPTLQQRFFSGEWISFGPLVIHQHGLRLPRTGNQTLEMGWHEIERLTVEAGSFLVECKDRRSIRLPAGKIPNLEILLQLVKQGVIA